jgi:hypothetical protein
VDRLLLHVAGYLGVFLLEHLELHYYDKRYINHLPDLVELLDVPQEAQSLLDEGQHPDHALQQNGYQKLPVLGQRLLNHCVEQHYYRLYELVRG